MQSFWCSSSQGLWSLMRLLRLPLSLVQHAWWDLMGGTASGTSRCLQGLDTELSSRGLEPILGPALVQGLLGNLVLLLPGKGRDLMGCQPAPLHTGFYCF